MRKLLLIIIIKLCHLWPFKRGMTYLSSNAIIRSLFKEVDAIYRVKLRSGVEMYVSSDDYNGRMVALFGALELAITTICRHLLKSDDILLDIGANYGAIGLNCINIIGNAGEVHLFEPQPALCEVIEASIKNLEYNNIKLHRVGLLDKDGTEKLNLVDMHSGGASFISNHGSRSSIEVPTKDVSTYIKPIISNKIFGAKIDVEGADVIILRELLKYQNMRFVIFENEFNQQASDVWEEVSNSGRILLGIPDKIWMRIKVIRIREPKEMLKYKNFLVLPPIRDENKDLYSLKDLSMVTSKVGV